MSKYITILTAEPVHGMILQKKLYHFQKFKQKLKKLPQKNSFLVDLNTRFCIVEKLKRNSILKY